MCDFCRMGLLPCAPSVQGVSWVLLHFPWLRNLHSISLSLEESYLCFWIFCCIKNEWITVFFRLWSLDRSQNHLECWLLVGFPSCLQTCHFRGGPRMNTLNGPLSIHLIPWSLTTFSTPFSCLSVCPDSGHLESWNVLFSGCLGNRNTLAFQRLMGRVSCSDERASLPTPALTVEKLVPEMCCLSDQDPCGWLRLDLVSIFYIMTQTSRSL